MLNNQIDLEQGRPINQAPTDGDDYLGQDEFEQGVKELKEVAILNTTNNCNTGTCK